MRFCGLHLAQAMQTLTGIDYPKLYILHMTQKQLATKPFRTRKVRDALKGFEE